MAPGVGFEPTRGGAPSAFYLWIAGRPLNRSGIPAFDKNIIKFSMFKTFITISYQEIGGGGILPVQG